jgi:8-oxo-dGTP pyrophosphatase MutT (NUDIX family)
MKNNIVPIIESIDNNKLVPSAKTVYRNCIMLVIKHPTENKFLYLHNKKFGWNVLVQGGIEEGENSFVSAIREMTEETGYCDIKSITKLDFEMDNVYYAAHKNQNRYAIIETFYIELNSLKQIEHENESEILFDTYENLYDIFGAPFRHHYYLLGIATGKQQNVASKDQSKLGTLDLINHKVTYRNINDKPNSSN